MLGRNLRQNQFSGLIGEELDRLYAAIRQDQILNSPSVKANRTPSGTILKATPKKVGGAGDKPTTEELTGERWRIDGWQMMEFAGLPHIVNVVSEDGSRKMRVMGVPLGPCERSDSICRVPDHHPDSAAEANHFWPERKAAIEVPSNYPIFEWPNTSSAFTSTWPAGPRGPIQFYWSYKPSGTHNVLTWYQGHYGDWRGAGSYFDQHICVLQKLATPFVDPMGVQVDYYLTETYNPFDGMPDKYIWQRFT